MKRLFTVREKATKKYCYADNGELLYFSNKSEAKDFRDLQTNIHNKEFVVSLGPDHRRYREEWT